MRGYVRIGIAAIIAIVLAHVGDRWAYTHLARPGVYDHDLGRMLRSVGFLPIWLLVGLALWLETRDRRRALLIALAPTAGALVCEVLKMLLRRERPNLHAGAYFFRPFHDQPFYTRDIGLPSSHAMVAFSGAWVLCRIYPRACPVWIALAVGCAVTRVMAQAHFLSDVTVGAVAAYFVVDVCWRASHRSPAPAPSR